MAEVGFVKFAAVALHVGSANRREKTDIPPPWCRERGNRQVCVASMGRSWLFCAGAKVSLTCDAV